MAAGETLYTFRVPYADVLQRGRQQTVRLEAYRDGALVAPSASGSSFSLYSPTGEAIVSARAVTVTASVATAVVTTDDLPATLALGEGYIEEWVLVMPDGTVRTVRREAAIARRLLHPPAGDVDFAGEYPDLAGEFAEHTGWSGTSLQPAIDEAWSQILERLFQRDRWPDLIVSSSALRSPLRQLVLHIVFKALFRRGVGTTVYRDLMDLHLKRFEASWDAMALRYDRDQDGRVDSLDRELAGTGIVRRHIGPRAALWSSRDPRW